MKLVDANVLLTAANQAADAHESARGWLLDALEGNETIGLTWSVVLAFVRLSTQRLIFPQPLGVRDASSMIDQWLAAPPTQMVRPGNLHRRLLFDLLEASGAAGNLVNDAHLAALAIEHHGEVVSFDTDFARFPGLRWHLPGEARARRNPG